MSVHYHPGKMNVVADALSRLCMGRLDHVEEKRKELVKDVHMLALLVVPLMSISERRCNSSGRGRIFFGSGG